jgi:fibronectin type 3 domain-containing protein
MSKGSLQTSRGKGMVKWIWLLLTAVGAFAGSARLVWDDPNPAGTVGKYAVYHASSVTGAFALLGETQTNAFTLPRLQSGAHFFYVTAVGTNGLESDPSNQVLAPVVNPPQNTKILIEIP